jgi:Domain of unknown function (DUF1996)
MSKFSFTEPKVRRLTGPRQRQNSTEELIAFPPGFRMLTGSSNLRHFVGDTASLAISYACLDFVHGGGPETHGFPTVSIIRSLFSPY